MKSACLNSVYLYPFCKFDLGNKINLSQYFRIQAMFIFNKGAFYVLLLYYIALHVFVVLCQVWYQ